jgi:hypothetical protein
MASLIHVCHVDVVHREPHRVELLCGVHKQRFVLLSKLSQKLDLRSSRRGGLQHPRRRLVAQRRYLQFST